MLGERLITLGKGEIHNPAMPPQNAEGTPVILGIHACGVADLHDKTTGGLEGFKLAGQ